MIDFCKKLTSYIDMTGIVIVFATLIPMFLALLANVILRYAFNSGITWAYEIHNILLPWLVAGGAVMASSRGSNIAVTVFVGTLPEIGRRFCAIAVHMFVSIVSGIVAYSSMPIVKAARFSRLAETGIPQMYGYISIIYAFSAIALISLLLVVSYLLGEKTEITDPTVSNYS